MLMVTEFKWQSPMVGTKNFRCLLVLNPLKATFSNSSLQNDRSHQLNVKFEESNIKPKLMSLKERRVAETWQEWSKIKIFFQLNPPKVTFRSNPSPLRIHIIWMKNLRNETDITLKFIRSQYRSVAEEIDKMGVSVFL